MMFRKLYWVTEQLDESGRSKVVGVYTSIPDLINKGLRWSGDKYREGFRITLTKLDCNCEPFGMWSSPEFEGLEQDLQQFIATDEFTEEHCKALVKEVESFIHAKA